ncbi:uncharacterized protein RHO17_000434 [Thomomys bottae]
MRGACARRTKTSKGPRRGAAAAAGAGFLGEELKGNRAERACARDAPPARRRRPERHPRCPPATPRKNLEREEAEREAEAAEPESTPDSSLEHTGTVATQKDATLEESYGCICSCANLRHVHRQIHNSGDVWHSPQHGSSPVCSTTNHLRSLLLLSHCL